MRYLQRAVPCRAPRVSWRHGIHKLLFRHPLRYSEDINLADPVAYGCDRRKDLLLQENGYLVLRFLAENVGRELDMVLDAILRALSQRGTTAHATRLNFVRGGRP